MTKYSKYQPKKSPHRGINPIWRGIGCVIILVTPALSYLLAHLLLQLAKQYNLVPAVLLGYIQFPAWVFNTPALRTIASFIGSLQDLWAMLILFLVILLILFGLLSLVYSSIYPFIGPPRYSEMDAPPERRKAKEYKR